VKASGRPPRKTLPMADRIRLRDRYLARRVARKVWMECGPGEDARMCFERDEAFYGIDPALLLLLVQIAMALFEYWRKNNIKEPSVVPSCSEPVSWEEDIDDASE
jgi:hypothetical protein